MLVRKAHEIEWERRSNRSISPESYQNEIAEICSRECIVFSGFIGDWKGGNTKLKLRCENGHEWKSTTIRSFIGKHSRCPVCTGKDPLSKEGREKIIRRICEADGISFLGFVGEWRGGDTKLNLRCSDGHVWNSATIRNFVYKGNRCPVCNIGGGVGISQDVYQERLFCLCRDENLEFLGFSGEWRGNKSKAKIKCSCGRIWTTYVNALFAGCRCPDCSSHGYKTNKPGVLYVQKLYSDALVGIKFGITNKTTAERMRSQSRKSSLRHEIFHELALQDGKKILELENKIKEAMKGKSSFISKEDMPDGYTETVSPSELSNIMYIIKTFEKEL